MSEEKMNGNKKDNERKEPVENDRVMRAVGDAFQDDASDDTKEKLRTSLRAFRKDLLEQPYVQKLENTPETPAGLSGWFSLKRLRPILVATAGCGVIALLFWEIC